MKRKMEMIHSQEFCNLRKLTQGGKASRKIWIPRFVRHKPADVAKQSVRLFCEKRQWEEERKRLSNGKHHTNIQRTFVFTITDIQHTPSMQRPKRTSLLSENIFARRIQMFPNQRHLKKKIKKNGPWNDTVFNNAKLKTSLPGVEIGKK